MYDRLIDARDGPRARHRPVDADVSDRTGRNVTYSINAVGHAAHVALGAPRSPYRGGLRVLRQLKRDHGSVGIDGLAPSLPSGTAHQND
jgi:hypothetical protein